ncbi:MAG: acetyl-CoA carboxylase biotin carboxyl carrier protein [Victivallales bacterium]|nr:acetyl-CoA carboxylase biotin carboxyl carrier protein [Victivallales bacterium]
MEKTMNLNTVGQLAQLMRKYELTEVEFEQAGGRIRLARSANAVSAMPAAVPAEPASQPDPIVSESAAPEVETIVSPLVGTFYASSSPEGTPLVSEGSRVEPGMVVCIVEAMKVMNEIRAEKAGLITRVLVKNASPVEYGQVLFEMTSDKAK